MTHMKKLASLLLAMVMAFALAAPAFAADEIYIEVPAGTEGHKYNVFQIFTGTVSTDGEALNDIDWGRDADPAKIVAALKGITGLTQNYFDDTKLPADTTDAEAVAAALRPARGVTADEKLIAQALKTVMPATGIGELTGSETGGTRLPVAAGYYLIDDTSDEEGLNLLQVTKGLTIRIKTSKVPTMFKKVWNGSAWVDATDYEIGDTVPFRLVATLPKGYEGMTEYGLTFHDKMGAGLTFNNDITVKYFTPAELDSQGNPVGEGTPLAAKDWRVDSGAAVEDADCTFEVVIANAKGTDSSIKGLEDGSVIVVEYTATLNEDAAIGNPGNLNTAWMSDTKGNKTPEDPVGVFTFELGITKTNADGSVELSGAVFTLEKKNAAGEWELIEEFTAEQVQKTDAEGNPIVDAEGNPVMENGPLFQLDSLTAGDYRLTETEAPEGYTGLAAPIEFTVSYVAGTNDAGEPTLTAVTVVTNNANQEIAGNVNGSITGAITNYTGSQLPETGGIGTTIFYILGGILVVGAAVLLITKRRMGASEE